LQPIVARLGMLNALAQLLLKLTSPGVPDLYQGQELWDFSLVDPDNRRPVDYALRQRLLADLRLRIQHGDVRTLARELVDGWEDGRIKLYVTHRALALRSAKAVLFRTAQYHPLVPAGERVAHLLAYVREWEGDAVVTVVPRMVAELTRESGYALPDRSLWKGSFIEGTEALLGGRWRNAFTGEELVARPRGVGVALAADELFADFPLALLERSV
ncbi:MAG: malto-oligosyltrehalose synthase, partial [Gemmatimonadota bacterium]|nr:malto-oligosyltrehalose synthase [Gemmatimonadota bacterium]